MEVSFKCTTFWTFSQNVFLIYVICSEILRTTIRTNTTGCYQFLALTLLSLSCLLAAEELEGAETLSGDEELPVAAEPDFQLPSASTEVPLLPQELAATGTFDLLRFMAALMYAAELEICGCICWAGEPW